MARIYNAALVSGEASAFIQIKNSLGNYGFSDAAVISNQQVRKTSEFLSDSDLLGDT